MNESCYRIWRGTPLLLAVCLALPGCYNWVPIEPPIASTLAESHQTQVRLILTAGDSVVLYKPGVSGDSIAGYSASSQVGWPDSFVPIEDVAGAEERRSNTGASVALVGGGILAAGLIALLVTAISVMGDPDY